MEFPQINLSNLKGMTGQAYFQKFVNEQLKCIYHPIHQENDFGLDGYIEIVIDGKVTGKLVGIQIKHGNSYFNNLTDYGYKYIGEKKHLNYYLNKESATFIIIMDENFERMNWIRFDVKKTKPIGDKKWWIKIPEENELDTNFKEAIFKEAADVTDFEHQIEFNWAINDALKETDRLMLAIPKDDIIQNSFVTINEYIDRICIDRKMLLSSRTSMDIFFPEYSYDLREIFKIPEIMRWLKKSIDIGIPWFYFLDYKQANTCLNLLIHSYCRVTDVFGIGTKYLCDYNKMDLKNFLEKNFDNMNRFIEKNRISEEINKEITDGIVKYLTNNK